MLFTLRYAAKINGKWRANKIRNLTVMETIVYKSQLRDMFGDRTIFITKEQLARR